MGNDLNCSNPSLNQDLEEKITNPDVGNGNHST